jgi:flagellar protein FlgJ
VDKLKPSDFVSTLFPKANPICQDNGIPTVGCLAQCALETGWGEHAPGNNYFGIKKWRSKQQSTTQQTKEYYGVKPQRTVAEFVAYEDFEESVFGYCDFAKSNPRYKTALKHPDSWRSYLDEIAKAGYATDPRYREKLESIGTTIEREVYGQGLMV